jgi:hypothetical protein
MFNNCAITCCSKLNGLRNGWYGWLCFNCGFLFTTRGLYCIKDSFFYLAGKLNQYYHIKKNGGFYGITRGYSKNSKDRT